MTWRRPTGWRGFLVIWGGQVASMTGSGLTAFALGVWVFERTGSATMFTLIAVAASTPPILLSPFAGVLVDRFDRRWMMALSDGGGALATLLVLTLFFTGRLELWHLYPLVALSAASTTLQFPAFSAVTTLLVPKRHFGRAGGLMEFGFAGAEIVAPLVAGLLLVRFGLGGVLAVDLTTFLLAVAAVLAVRVAHPPRSAAGEEGSGSFLREAIFGWTYIRRRPGLLALLGYFAAVNFLLPIGMVLATPLVLGFAGADRLGLALGIGAAGSLAGSIAMSVWGGPARRILGVLGFTPLIALGFIVAGLRPSVPLIAAGLFLVFAALPVVNASSQAIWLAKTDADVQGRVFATRRMIAQATAPIGFLVAGPLSDRLFVPLLMPGGALAAGAGGLFGTGPGRGIGLLYVLIGLLFAALAAAGLASPRLRRLEDELPDAPGGELPEAAPAGA